MIVRCIAGKHFYDNKKYETCPICSRTNSEDEMLTYRYDDKRIEKTKDVYLTEKTEPDFQQIYIDNVDQNLTKRFYSEEKQNNFITGWLVCIAGPEKGRDYRIYHGINKVGRGYDMDINIEDDQSLSRTTYCRLVYDIRSNKYYIVPVNGALVYLNGDSLTKPEEIYSGDMLKLGNSEFDFIAFCREGRTWNEINKKKNDE